jgi:hypothetical protein
MPSISSPGYEKETLGTEEEVFDLKFNAQGWHAHKP